jgi:flagellum-specific peptidoglycan hydrolase FlgJ
MINYNQQIYDSAVNNGATSWLAKLLIAQSRFETGDYGNNQSKTNNNIFGFKYSPNSQYAKKGNTSPEGDPYAKYETINDAIGDYINRWMLLNSKQGGTRLEEFNQIPEGDTLTFATKLKDYGYYHTPSNETKQQSIDNYKRGLDAKLKRMVVVDWYFANKKTINTTAFVFLGVGIVASVLYILKKRKVI